MSSKISFVLLTIGLLSVSVSRARSFSITNRSTDLLRWSFQLATSVAGFKSLTGFVNFQELRTTFLTLHTYGDNWRRSSLRQYSWVQPNQRSRCGLPKIGRDGSTVASHWRNFVSNQCNFASDPSQIAKEASGYASAYPRKDCSPIHSQRG